VKIKKFAELLHAYGNYETKKIKSILNISANREKELFFTTDSREIKENSVFIAIKGANTNGHRYVNDCFLKGAVISIVEDFGDYKGLCFKVKSCIDFINKIASEYYAEIKPYTIALTGSNGKTTTKEWLFSLLKHFYDERQIFCNPGNKNSEIGLPVGILNGLDEKKEIAVLEMGMAKEGDIAYLKENYPPDFSLLLNIGTAHIGNTGSLEKTYDEKSRIFCEKKPILINISDSTIVKHIEKLNTSYKLYFFGLAKDIRERTKGIYLKRYTYSLDNLGELYTEVDIMILNPKNNICFQKRLTFKGLYHKGLLLNLCAAFTAIYIKKENISFLQKADTLIKTVQDRFTIKKIEDNLLISDFYNSSIESLEYALETIKKIIDTTTYQKSICVLGSIAETGSFNEKIHENIGVLLNKYNVNTAILYTKNKDIEFVSRNYNNQKIYSEDSTVISDEIVERIKRTKNTIYLFKASRSIQLEEVYENVLESFS
jgi:UDP-N-acetylmuramoyl-tripeptide--D-alanyl-D-alanine ligase